MLFNRFGNRTVKHLRKEQGLTAQELAMMIKVGSSMIRKIDHFKIKDVPEPLKSKVEPVLRGK